MWDKLKRPFSNQSQQTDDFIKRLRSLVIGEGMLKEGNISLIDLAIRDMPEEGSVVEIGSYGGLSTNLIIHLMQKHQKKNVFFSCDAWVYEGFNDHLVDVADLHIDGKKGVLRSDYSKYMKNAFIQATRFLHPDHLPHSFHLLSDAFFECWNLNQNAVDLFGQAANLGGPICFAYIDGGHSYETAWKDFQNVDRHLVKNGFILLDDSADGQSFGSAKMMSEIKKNKQYKVVGKNPNYLIQKI